MRGGLIFAFLIAVTVGVYNHRALVPLPLRKEIGLTADIVEIRAHKTPLLTQDMAEAGLTFGAPVHLRIFKEEATLELWVRRETSFHLFRSYPICNHSGEIGPKLREGDKQAPEGFYRVTKDALNPNSNFHLSFNLGFPNEFDRKLDRTGSFLMVHGDCRSVGCYAMTDPLIEEIYVIVEAALDAGQPSVPVHAFPFRMTAERLRKAKGQQWHDFWENLAEGDAFFATNGYPPQTSVDRGRYLFH